MHHEASPDQTRKSRQDRRAASSAERWPENPVGKAARPIRRIAYLREICRADSPDPDVQPQDECCHRGGFPTNRYHIRPTEQPAQQRHLKEIITRQIRYGTCEQNRGKNGIQKTLMINEQQPAPGIVNMLCARAIDAQPQTADNPAGPMQCAPDRIRNKHCRRTGFGGRIF